MRSFRATLQIVLEISHFKSHEFEQDGRRHFIGF